MNKFQKITNAKGKKTQQLQLSIKCQVICSAESKLTSPCSKAWRDKAAQTDRRPEKPWYSFFFLFFYFITSSRPSFTFQTSTTRSKQWSDPRLLLWSWSFSTLVPLQVQWYPFSIWGPKRKKKRWRLFRAHLQRQFYSSQDPQWKYRDRNHMSACEPAPRETKLQLFCKGTKTFTGNWSHLAVDLRNFLIKHSGSENVTVRDCIAWDGSSRLIATCEIVNSWLGWRALSRGTWRCGGC